MSLFAFNGFLNAWSMLISYAQTIPYEIKQKYITFKYKQTKSVFGSVATVTVSEVSSADVLRKKKQLKKKLDKVTNSDLP